MPNDEKQTTPFNSKNKFIAIFLTGNLNATVKPSMTDNVDTADAYFYTLSIRLTGCLIRFCVKKNEIMLTIFRVLFCMI